MESEYAGFDDTPEGEQPWQRRLVGDDLPTEGWPGRGELDKKNRGRYKVLRSQFLLQAMARHEVCWFCKGAIDYAEPYGSPWAAEVHHLDVVSANPDPKHYLDMTRWAKPNGATQSSRQWRAGR